MKRALLIVAAVAGYFLLEAVLLLGVIVPRHPGFLMPSPYAAFVGFGQLLVIPGMAALFSRIVYGPQKWGRRSLLIFLTGPLVLLTVITPFVVIAVLLDWTFILSKILFAIAMTAIYAAIVMGLRWCIRRSRRWNVEAEATRWLAERWAGSAERKWRNRGIRLASCIPLTIVLFIFLFLPETWGLFARMTHPHSGSLAGYRVKIPLIWIVQYWGEDSDGRSSVAGFFGRGIGSGFNPFRYDSLSYWRFATSPSSGAETTDYDRRLAQEDDIIERRDVLVGREHIQCVDYRYRWELDWQNSRRSSATAHVSCQGAARLRASFDGSRTLLPDFYRVLSEIKSR